MGGSPEPNLEKIKQMVYMNHTGQGTESRDKYLGEFDFHHPGCTFALLSHLIILRPILKVCDLSSGCRRLCFCHRR